jgi:hypothetical protein
VAFLAVVVAAVAVAGWQWDECHCDHFGTKYDMAVAVADVAVAVADVAVAGWQ